MDVSEALVAMNAWADLVTDNPWTDAEGNPARVLVEVGAEGATVFVTFDGDPLPDPERFEDDLDAGRSFALRRPTLARALSDVAAIAEGAYDVKIGDALPTVAAH